MNITISPDIANIPTREPDFILQEEYTGNDADYDYDILKVWIDEEIEGHIYNGRSIYYNKIRLYDGKWQYLDKTVSDNWCGYEDTFFSNFDKAVKDYITEKILLI